MQMWVLRPPGFDPRETLATRILGAWRSAERSISILVPRWNAELWAAQGYVLAMPNPRGSTGFGQSSPDEISGDWEARCTRISWPVSRGWSPNPKSIPSMAAAGASFGGHMMNWFQGHTGQVPHLVTHCGVQPTSTPCMGLPRNLWFGRGGPRHPVENPEVW